MYPSYIDIANLKRSVMYQSPFMCTYIIIYTFIHLLTIQGLVERFDDIVVAVGSGGTVCGLALANHLTGAKLKYV